MALITVVVPTHNRPEYLGQALESVRAQTFSDYELLIADDASSADVRSLLFEQDPRERYLKRERNVGMGLNIWKAMAAAKTKYVVTLHDDDIWEPNFLQVLVEALEQNRHAAVAFCDFWHVDPENELLREVTEKSSRDFGRANLSDGLHKPFIYNGVWKRSIPAAMGAIFRYSAIDWGNFPIEVGTFYDEWLAYLAVRGGDAIWYTSKRLSRYRVHQHSETSNAGTYIHTTVKQRAQEEFITRSKLLDPLVEECHVLLRRKHRRALIGLTISAAIVCQKELARSRIDASQTIHPSWFLSILRASLHMPPLVAKTLLSVKHKLS